jgi:hypothetical protein
VNNPILATGSIKIGGQKIGREINLPSSIKKVSKNAFYGFEQLEYVFYDGSIDEYAQIEFVNKYASPMFYAEHLSIQGYIVGGEITIGGTNTVYPGAFSNCKDITSVKFDVENPTKVSIGESAFRNCTNLESVEMDKVLVIEDMAFSGCTKLQVETFTFVAKIGAYAFYNCDSIKQLKIEVGGSVEIGESAFEDCSALQSLIVNNGKTIGNSAFQNCALSSVTIKGGLTSIGDKAFAGNTDVKVDLSDCTQNIQAGEDMFANCGNFNVYFVSATVASQYKIERNWRNYADRLSYVD